MASNLLSAKIKFIEHSKILNMQSSTETPVIETSEFEAPVIEAQEMQSVIEAQEMQVEEELQMEEPIKTSEEEQPIESMIDEESQQVNSEATLAVDETSKTGEEQESNVEPEKKQKRRRKYKSLFGKKKSAKKQRIEYLPTEFEQLEKYRERLRQIPNEKFAELDGMWLSTYDKELDDKKRIPRIGEFLISRNKILADVAAEKGYKVLGELPHYSTGSPKNFKICPYIVEKSQLDQYKNKDVLFPLRYYVGAKNSGDEEASEFAFCAKDTHVSN